MGWGEEDFNGPMELRVRSRNTDNSAVRTLKKSKAVLLVRTALQARSPQQLGQSFEPPFSRLQADKHNEPRKLIGNWIIIS